MVVYIDGAAVGAKRLDVDIDTEAPGDGLRIGKLHGDYDEAAVYASALSPERIAAHWTRGAGEVGVGGEVCPVAPVDGYGGMVASGQPSTYLRLGEFVDRGDPPVPDERVAFDVSTDGVGCLNGAVSATGSSVPGALSFDADQGLHSPASSSWLVTRSDADLPAGDAARSMEVWARSTSDANKKWLMRYGPDAGGRFGLYKESASELQAYYGGTNVQFTVSPPDGLDDGV
ncbi:MAG: hypothetical protein GY938_22560, partial [Ketobacter sp.]|nr:hypothetical protein [Ketobacter sp.]